MIKNPAINFNSVQVPAASSSHSANTTEATPNPGEHRVLTRQQAFAPQRAKERSLAEALRAEYATSSETQSAPQKAFLSQLLGELDITKTQYQWPPEKRFVISSDADWIIKKDSKIHASERKIPKENVLLKASLSKGSLANVDLEGRLTLIGHGSINRFDGMDASQLATKLADAGLKQVGVLKFKACHVGKGGYLEKVKEELVSRGIDVGYISGPTGIHADQRFPVKIAGMNFNVNSVPVLPPKVVGNRYVPFIPEKFGLKVIKGNVDISFQGTRYDIPLPPGTSER